MHFFAPPLFLTCIACCLQFMSISNFSHVFSGQVGAWLQRLVGITDTDLSMLPHAMVARAALQLLPLCLLTTLIPTRFEAPAPRPQVGEEGEGAKED